MMDTGDRFDEDDELDPGEPLDGEPLDGEPLELEITDVLDLHTFAPREVADLVRDYLELAWEQGLRQLRIIHGKGRGVQRRTVRKILDGHPRVVSFGDPPGEAGGWGATWVTLGDGEASPDDG